MPVYFYNGLPLIRDGAVAVDEACCCGEPLCDCACCPDEDFGGFKISIVAAEPAGGFAEPCCEDVGGVYFALITEENPTACEGRTFVTLGCGQLEIGWNIGCGGTVKTLNVGVILRSGLGTAEAQVNNQVALTDPCSDLNFTGLQDTLTFPGVGDCADLTISAEALPCGISSDPPGMLNPQGISGTSQAEGTLSGSAAAAGDAAATSILTGRLDGDFSIQGSATAASFVEGTATAIVFAAGETTAASATTGDLKAAAFAEGDVSGVSLLSGSVSAILAASGGASAASQTTAGLAASAFAAGSAAATSVTTGRLDGDASIEGQAKATSTTTSSIAATTFASGDALAASVTTAKASAEATLAGEVTATSVLTGALESCCCGDCIRFRYTISGLANSSCSGCSSYNTDNDSPDVNPDESCVYAAQWQSSDCGGQNIVFNAELICDDDGSIRLSGTVQDTAIIGPLIDPPNGPTPTNDIMSGTDTFTLGTPCSELEITLSRDTGSQTTCDFDNATVVLKVIDCPSNQAVIEKVRRKARRRKARKAQPLPVVCQHRGELLGDADCGCAGKPKVYHCTLLGKPCTPKSVGKPIVRIKGGPRIESPQACSVCDHFAR
jgi:hypothetical protein